MSPGNPRTLDYREPPPEARSVGGDALPAGARPVEGEEAADDEPEVAGAAGFELRQAQAGAATHGERLDKALVGLAPEFSRSHLQQLIELGHVQVDGQVVRTAARRLRAGQRLQLELVPTDESRAFRPEPMCLLPLYEDEHLLVLDKPAGLVVHPAPGHWSGTLLNGLLARHPGAAHLPRAGIVHRLDKDTSGVMMVGKTLEAVTALVRDIAARDVHRRYLALAHGDVQAAEQQISAPIGRDPRERVRMAVVASGKAARTDVKRLASATVPGAGVVSALSCTLHTGRTHQIRVHLAWRGHPLVADSVYGGRAALGLQRQALHATELHLAHPVTRVPLQFHCPPPVDFAAAWHAVAGDAAGT